MYGNDEFWHMHVLNSKQYSFILVFVLAVNKWNDKLVWLELQVFAYRQKFFQKIAF